MTDTPTHQPGDRVRGQAEIGDRVTYHDMANQDGTVWTVVGTADTSWYLLVATDRDESRSTDLRQYGWTFA